MKKPNLNKIIADNLDKTSHIPNKGRSTLSTNGWLDQYKSGGLTPNKAREILHDKEVHGHPLTDAQRRFFGAISKGNTMKYAKGGQSCPEGFVYSEEDDDCIPVEDAIDMMNENGGFDQKKFNTGINLSDPFYNFNYGFSYNPITKKDITHTASLGLPSLFNVGTNQGSLNLSGSYSPGKNLRGDLSLGVPISRNKDREDKITLSGGMSKDFMTIPSRKADYNVGLEYAGKMFGKKGPNVRINASYGKYKRGGGYFPEYHSWAPPRMKDGGPGDAVFYPTVPATPIPQNYDTAPYNLEHFTQYVPMYKDTYGIPRINNGDIYDEFKANLIKKGIPAQEAANITMFMNQYYTTEGKLKQVPFSNPYYEASVDPNFKSIDDPERQKQIIEKHKKLQGKLGTDYYAHGGDISIPNLDADKWLMKYAKGGASGSGGPGDGFLGIFKRKGGRGRGGIGCPTNVCGTGDIGQGGGGLHLGEFFSNIGHGIGQGAKAVGHFLGDIGEGIGDIFHSIHIGDGHRRMRKCMQKGMEWDPATKTCKPRITRTFDYGDSNDFPDISHNRPFGSSYIPSLYNIPTDNIITTTTTEMPEDGMPGGIKDINGIVWNYRPYNEAERIKLPAEETLPTQTEFERQFGPGLNTAKYGGFTKQKYAEGGASNSNGPGDGSTPGPIVIPYAASDNAVTPPYIFPFKNIFNQPLTTSTSKFNYEDYYNKASKYLSRPIFKGTSLTAKDIADTAQKFYNDYNYEYPLDLLLTQGQMESGLGTKLKSKNNFFNIGNTDSGSTRNFPTAKDSLYSYMNTMYNDYLLKGKKKPEDLLKPKGFVNYQGNRYASAPDYEKALANQRAVVQKHLSKKEGGSVDTLSKYPNGGVVCKPGQIRFRDKKGERCIDITSKEYTKLYKKGIGSFQKFDKANNKWISTTQDDPDAIFVSNKNTLPPVTVTYTPTEEEREAKRKKLWDTLNKANREFTLVSESTRDQRLVSKRNEQIQNDELIKNYRINNPYWANRSDQDILEQINFERYQKAHPKEQATIRAMTPFEGNRFQANIENDKLVKKLLGPFGGETEGEKIERWHEDDRKHDEEVAAVNSAILARDNGQPFTFPTNETKTWNQMTGSEKAYVEGLARSRSLQIFPGATSKNFIKTEINSLNPFPVLSGWYKGFAQAPYIAQKTNSIKPYFAATLDPAITVGAVMLGQPELSAGEALTTNILNPLKPINTLKKASIAAEEGNLAHWAINKIKKDAIKDVGKDINKSLKTNMSNPVVAQQTNQFLNTGANQGINSVGLFNNFPSLIYSGMIPSHNISTIQSQKYGGQVKSTKNWLDKYK